MNCKQGVSVFDYGSDDIPCDFPNCSCGDNEQDKKSCSWPNCRGGHGAPHECGCMLPNVVSLVDHDLGSR